MLGLSLSVLLLGAPAHTSALPGDVRGELRPIGRVWLRSPELDAAALAAAVSARLSDKQILLAGAAAGPREGLAAVCHVTLQGEGALQLEVILSDGRLYQRTIAAPSAGRERAAARLIASTLAAIEDASATPDRRDGIFTLPIADAPATPNPPTVTTDPPTITTNPEPASQRQAKPASQDPAKPASRLQREPLALGVALALGPGFGLGAPGAGLGLAGGGGGLRIDLRLRRGVTVGAGFRGHARVHDDLALGRFRGALVVGHVLRRGPLELALLAGPTLETWQVTQRGAPVA